MHTILDLHVHTLAVFPAPFWPVISVSGVPNVITALSESPAPKLRIPARRGINTF